MVVIAAARERERKSKDLSCGGGISAERFIAGYLFAAATAPRCASFYVRAGGAEEMVLRSRV